MAARANLLVFGDINIDAVARLTAPLAPGADNLPQQLELQLGGVGANAAVELAKWGVGARLAGCVGRDPFGATALEALARQGVNTDAVARSDAATGLFLIPVEPDGQRTIIGSRGANLLAPAASPAECIDGVAGVHLVGYSLLSSDTAAWQRELVERAAAAKIPISLDVGETPSRQARDAILELAPRLDALFVSLEETEALTGRDGAAALSAIAGCGARVVILKQGAGGCQFLLSGGARWWKIPPLEVDVVDTTGAGDAFAAGWWMGRLRGWETGDAVALANACGAATTTVLGAGEALPGPDAVLRVLEAQPVSGRESSATQRLLRLLREQAVSVGTKAE